MDQTTIPNVDVPETKLGEQDEDIAPWTEIEPGRFMPRRTRGSCKGRALG